MLVKVATGVRGCDFNCVDSKHNMGIVILSILLDITLERIPRISMMPSQP